MFTELSELEQVDLFLAVITQQLCFLVVGQRGPLRLVLTYHRSQ